MRKFKDLATAETPSTVSALVFNSSGEKGAFVGNAFVKVHESGDIELEVVSASGATLATHRFRDIAADALYIESTKVVDEHQRKGINRALADLMLSLRPGTRTIRRTLTQDNEAIYFKQLANGLTPEQALKKTPAYLVTADNFEWVPRYSNLPSRPGKEIDFVVQRRE